MQQTYPCFFYRQRPGSPLQVAFVAPSCEIDAWARVPTKRTGNIRNFQRAALKQHVKEVQKFFTHDQNASPTAVVIGFDTIRSAARIKLLSDNRTELSPDSIMSGTPQTGALQIEWASPIDSDDAASLRAHISERRTDLEECIAHELKEVVGLKKPALQTLSDEIHQRVLSGKALLGAQSEDEVDDEDDDDDAMGDDGGTSEPEESLDFLSDLSPAAREAMAGLSPSEQQIVIGRLEFLAQTAANHIKSLPVEDLREVASAVADELKPGILIDGQHRIMGTKKLGNIPFLVCALPSAPWPELAFQFLVTNRTAKRVQESLLINIVGNSLSKTQRAAIEERLRDAGIRVGLIEAVMKAHEDEQSPFFGYLQFGIKGELGFIDAAAMRNKVIKYWYERKGPIHTLFDHLCDGRLKRDRTDNWKSEEIWFDFFISFWSAVRERYVGSSVFSSELEDTAKKKPASKLMTATVLKIFQETVIRNIEHYLTQKQQKDGIPISDSIKSSSDFAGLVTNSLKPLTPEFFQGWTITGFDGSKGARDDLAEAINLVLDQTKTVAQLKKDKQPHRLFKEAN